ncbi:chromate efflux transporter [Mucilaginibacter sp. X5P1]|uniref:chromate efflux transporter n=1 Tax=Mucilaginibacter sp. X5P1 TaxID=2723088 RepID=UPI0016101168|nr:chromate efflux transporter [Mucilaginibacter sp. X5P1]MBB6138528.1 chromate transporter [Mucilaginibacter sp. X5P1]
MELAIKSISMAQSKKVTLGYLFYTFLKIGAVSFGGYMALVSLVQKIMVDKDETLENEVIIDSITVASLIPGPLAVNIVAYIGYHLKGKTGALLSMIGVLLPASTLMLLLAWLYFSYAYKFEWANIMHYVVAVVSAIILSTGFNLYKKEIGKNYKKALLCLFTIIVMVLTSSYLITLGLIALGAIMGLIIERSNIKLNNLKNKRAFKFNAIYSAVISLFIINEVLFISGTYKFFNSPILKISMVFSGISLSLFGGGYVMIPIMQSLFVNELHWLTRQEFIDAIAFSQATPGPILVSATFIGYKLAGVMGAIIATAAMFAPSAIVMIMVSKLFKKTKDHSLAKDMIAGVKAVVIGLIIASAVRILYTQPFSLGIAVVAVAALILSFKYKVSPVYLIVASISIGIITKFLI